MTILFRMLRFLLFRLPPEEAHLVALRAAAAASRRRWVRNLLAWWFAAEEPALRTRCMGRDFPGPVGLAAGFDPDGAAAAGLAAIGFGHLEVGGVSPRPTLGRRPPRLGRLEDGAGLWYLPGQPSRGPEAAARNLGRIYPGVPVGVNLVPRRALAGESPAELVAEFAATARVLAPIASHLTIAAEAPGLDGPAPPPDPAALGRLVAAVVEARDGPGPPVLLKLPHDLEDGPFFAAASAALDAGAAGWVLGGGRRRGDGKIACGPVLLGRTEGRVADLRRRFGPGPVVIAAGGVTSGKDAYRLIAAGADLIQVMSALVYRGPATPGRIHRELARELRRAGHPNLDAARGRGG